jgi:hypothetical protein
MACIKILAKRNINSLIREIPYCYGLRDTSGINNKTIKARPW